MSDDCTCYLNHPDDPTADEEACAACDRAFWADPVFALIVDGEYDDPPEEAPVTGDMTTVTVIPLCDAPRCQAKAVVDGKTKFGPWAYACAEHAATWEIETGPGKGQWLVEG